MSRKKPAAPPAMALPRGALDDTSQMDLHLEPDIDPRKGISTHKATVILARGQMLHGIRITPGLHGRTKIDIPDPCPMKNSGGGALVPVTLSETQRAILTMWIGEQIELRLKQRRAAR